MTIIKLRKSIISDIVWSSLSLSKQTLYFSIKKYISLKINRGFRFNWSKLLFKFIGFADFSICKIIRWIKDKKTINKVKIKCEEKNRFNKILCLDSFPRVSVVYCLDYRHIG